MTPPQPIRLKSPLVIGLIGLIAVVVILVPVASLGLRVPWNRIGEYLAKPEIWDMLKLSLTAAFQSMLLAMVLVSAVLHGALIARSRRRSEGLSVGRDAEARQRARSQVRCGGTCAVWFGRRHRP